MTFDRSARHIFKKILSKAITLYLKISQLEHIWKEIAFTKLQDLQLEILKQKSFQSNFHNEFQIYYKEKDGDLFLNLGHVSVISAR